MPQSDRSDKEMICVWMRFNAKANKCIYYTDIGADTHRV